MSVEQKLSQRYVDKEKMIKFFNTHPDFMGHNCGCYVCLLIVSMAAVLLTFNRQKMIVIFSPCPDL